MVIVFPPSPYLNELFTYNDITYRWNGSDWMIDNPSGTSPISQNKKNSFNTILINESEQFNSFTDRSINFEGINLNVYSLTSNTLVFSAQPQTNSSSTFSGGTVSGATNFTGGLTANTIYATTYQNLPSSTFSGGTVTGPTNFTNGLTANTISATTYQNLPVSGLTAGQNISITGSNGNFTVSFTGSTGSSSIVYKSAISSATHTGTTNTVKYTQLIPANTFAAGDVVRITYRTAKTGGANSMTLRIYANATPDLTGSPILLGSHQNAGAPSYLVNQMIRHLAIKTATNNTEVYFAPGLGVATDYGLYDLTTTCAVDWTAQQYIVFALQLNTTGVDTAFGSLYLIEKP